MKRFLSLILVLGLAGCGTTTHVLTQGCMLPQDLNSKAIIAPLPEVDTSMPQLTQELKDEYASLQKLAGNYNDMLDFVNQHCQ